MKHYTRAEALKMVARCAEDDGPEDWHELRALFLALYEREPDHDDGDWTQVWSLVCAAAETGGAA